MSEITAPITKFGLGDKIFSIVYRNEKVPCTVCDATGQIVFRGEDLCCPGCDGRKERNSEQAKLFLDELPVKSIVISPTGIRYYARDLLIDDMIDDWNSCKEEGMLTREQAEAQFAKDSSFPQPWLDNDPGY